MWEVDNCRNGYQRVARQGSCLSSAQGIQYITVPFLRKMSSRNCGRLPAWARRVRMQMAARGSLALLSRCSLVRKWSSMAKGTPRRSWKAIFLRKVEQLPSSQPSQRSSRTGYLSAKRSTSSAMASPTVNANDPLQASRMARTRLRLNSRQSSTYLLCNARSRNCTPASLTSLPMNARKKGSRRAILPSMANPAAGTASAQMAWAARRKQSASSRVSMEMLSSRMMLKSFFFSSASCSRAEVSWASVLRPALSGVDGTLPLRQTHCPRSRGSSRAAVPKTRISSSKSAYEEAQVRSTRKICSFLLSYCAPCTSRTISPWCCSRAAWTRSSAESASRRSRRINLSAVSSRCRVSSSMSVCNSAQCSCPISESAACDFTMWSIKLGFVNNVIQQGRTPTLTNNLPLAQIQKQATLFNFPPPSNATPHDQPPSPACQEQPFALLQRECWRCCVANTWNVCCCGENVQVVQGGQPDPAQEAHEEKPRPRLLLHLIVQAIRSCLQH